jgi:hypothetical protein
MAHPPKTASKYVPENPLEHSTSLYNEMEFVCIHLGMPYDNWLKGRSEKSRILHMRFYRLYNAKQGLYSTPQKERLEYFAKLCGLEYQKF